MNKRLIPDSLHLNQIVSLLSLLALFVALAVLVLAVLTHHPFFDETVHAHYAWLISRGLSPHEDFWCVYPVLGYLAVQPLFLLVPASPSLFLALRLFSSAALLGCGIVLARHSRRVSGTWIWGPLPLALIVVTPKLGDFFAEFSIDHLAALCALLAFARMFAEPSRRRLALIASLSVLSVTVTPKYGWTLCSALGAYLAYACRQSPRRWRNGLTAALSILLTAAALAAVFRAFGCRLLQNLSWAHLFMGKWMARLEDCPIPLGRTALFFLLRHWFVGMVLLGGIAGWAARSFRPPRAAAWTGAGILVGTAVSVLLLRKYHEQYLAPLLLSLLVFPPYLAAAVAPRARALLGAALACALALSGAAQIPFRLSRFRPFDVDRVNPLVESTRGMGKGIQPARASLRTLKRLLSLVPAEETVAAVWDGHPIFRRDATFITYDMGPGCSFQEILPPGSEIRSRFRPEYLARELKKRPPALISPSHLDLNYPPGWLRVCLDFIASHPGLYREVDAAGVAVFLRSDLPDR